jgi:uncharacterized membrane protein YozB (DUF420 family)
MMLPTVTLIIATLASVLFLVAAFWPEGDAESTQPSGITMMLTVVIRTLLFVPVLVAWLIHFIVLWIYA